MRAASRARQIWRKVLVWTVAPQAPPDDLAWSPGSAALRSHVSAVLRGLRAAVHSVAALAAYYGAAALRYGISLNPFLLHDFDPACFAVNKARRARQLIVSDDGPAAPHWSRS